MPNSEMIGFGIKSYPGMDTFHWHMWWKIS